MNTSRSKTILITDASSGIGEATARHVARLGHQVFLGARRTERISEIAREITDSGGKATAHTLDVTDAASVNAFVTGAVREFSRVDVLVNNAGDMLLSFMAELRVDEWRVDRVTVSSCCPHTHTQIKNAQRRMRNYVNERTSAVPLVAEFNLRRGVDRGWERR